MYKKFNPEDYIDPLEIEYFPFLEQEQNLKNLRYGAIGQFHSPVANVGKNTVKNVGRVLRGTYYGALFFFNPMIVLLTQSRHILELGRFVARNDKEAILLKFKSSHIVPKEINYAIDLFNNGDVDRAISKLDDLDNELEKLNEIDDRINLLTVRAQFEAREGRFLVAAIDMISAATLVESSVTVSEHGEENTLAHISAKGKYYFCAVMFLRKYAFIHGVNEDLKSAFKRFGKKAEEFFNYEADYREKNGIHNTGFYDLKIFKLPKISFGKDTESATLNRILASNVKKLQYQIEALNDSSILLESIKNEIYKSSSDTMFLIDILESIDILINQKLSLSEDDLGAIKKFYSYCEKKIAKDMKSHLVLSECRFKVFIGEKVGALADCMTALDFCDEEEVDDVIYLFERMREQFSQDEQKEIVSYLLNHEKSNFINIKVRSYYLQMTGSETAQDDYLAKAFYPKDVEEFAGSINKIEYCQHYIRSGEEIIEIDTPSLRAILGAKFIKKHGEVNEPGLKRLNFKVLKNGKYHEHLPTRDLDGGAIEKKASLSETINDVCDFFYEIKGLESVRRRLDNERIKVGVFGVISTGKSTFINSLVGMELLGTDKRIATNIKTSIISGDRDCAEVLFLNGDKLVVKLDEVSGYTTEQENSYNNKEVERVIIYLKNLDIPPDIEIVDIPGMGAYEEGHEFHVRSVESELDEVDCVLMLVLPDDALDLHATNFIKKAVNEKKVPFLLLVNKSEDIGLDDREDLEENIIEKLSRHEIDIDSLGFYFVSSTMALGGKLKCNDTMDYFAMTSEDCIGESGIPEVENKLYKELSPLIKKKKQLSILSRTLFELTSSKKLDECTLKDSVSSLEGEGSELREELNRLEKLSHQISSPIMFSTLSNDLVQRFSLIDSRALIHKTNFDKDSISALSSNSEVYETLYGPIYNTYLVKRAEYIDTFYEEIKNMISIEIDRIKLKSRSFLDEDYSHIEELNENAITRGSSAKAGNFFTRTFRKDRVIEQTSKVIIEEIIEKDKKSYIRLIDEEISNYAKLFHLLEDRVDSIKKTQGMNESELESLIEEMNLSINKKNQTIRILMEIRDELCI
ncbi:hypothetical protein A9Q84_14455 [Halobacteriovorax marinus]|uniref:Dynamin N-terminal domain-containing protein n=1 Tax=Halobacteriovorax marinus TaxID=97084 RepID=A0A1Y5F5C6_9BACT|nr:hypothetical protein A9Q84_14455 [Halobacteriovorax marinus]